MLVLGHIWHYQFGLPCSDLTNDLQGSLSINLDFSKPALIGGFIESKVVADSHGAVSIPPCSAHFSPP